jgi:pyruvate,water dikinase
VVTWQKKLVVKELGSRANVRGLLDATDDFFFLSLDELCDLLEGTHSVALARAKVNGRRVWFDRFMTHEQDPSPFLRGCEPLTEETRCNSSEKGTLKGIGTSPGVVTGRARLIRTQKDIARLEAGDVLVCHGTDPGWSSAFSVVVGVVAQTGGMLAHFSCLSRERGIPAVSLPGAMSVIEEGSVITLNGSTGEVYAQR